MDGILIINKPKWYTSFDVVAKVRKAINSKKVGHTGTLDPMATGVLIVCVGQATPLVDVLTCDDKIYKTTIKIGIQTDTGDMTGNIRSVAVSATPNHKLSDISKLKFEQNLNYANSLNQSFDFSQTEIENVLNSFIGKQKQTPSIYSAIKVNGKKLYEYAREKKEVNIPSRDIEIYDIYDIAYNGKDEITYSVCCSKGTYIRTLNEDIANKLGVIGTTLELERLKVGDFEIKDSISIEEITEEKIISIEKIFKNRIDLDKKDEKRFLNGMLIDINESDGIFNVYIDNNYLGLGKIINKKIKRFIIVS